MEHIRFEDFEKSAESRRERPRKAGRRRARAEPRRSAPLALERGWTRSAWERCVETEVLIDFHEWLASDAREPLPSAVPTACAFTTALWTFVESAPFSETGQTAIEERVGRIHRAATRALQRELSPGFRVPPAPGGAVRFAAPVRSRSCDKPWSFFRLHIERSAAGSVFLTFGLASELRQHPALLAAQRG